MAFHLGCFRALRDRGLLEHVEVLSCVSGGSVIGGLYAYSEGDFDHFEQRAIELLRRGMHKDVASALLRPMRLVRIAGALASWPLHLFFAETLRRGSSRTDAFRDVLRERVFGEASLRHVKREGLAVILNACDLRTNSAFRFGSEASGCWRFGELVDDVSVADAVAASAAYPVLLPALDRQMQFEREGVRTGQRVVLTDGGIYENLGVSPLLPGRSASVTSNVFSPDYLVVCDAGLGLPDSAFPWFWPSRMKRSFEAVFRKAQDATRKRLHELAESHQIRGFIMPYLGQRDAALPWVPSELPARESVYKYPTDFGAMSEVDLDRLAARGEHLTRLLLAYYHPEL